MSFYIVINFIWDISYNPPFAHSVIGDTDDTVVG